MGWQNSLPATAGLSKAPLPTPLINPGAAIPATPTTSQWDGHGLGWPDGISWALIHLWKPFWLGRAAPGAVRIPWGSGTILPAAGARRSIPRRGRALGNGININNHRFHSQRSFG